jgi:HD-like signal output (HDOD) protein
MLRPLRDEWEMRFVSGGPEALDLLAQEPFDVVVSDMRMPGMDGIQLLTEVMHRHPDIVRIMLSGQSSQEAALRAVGPIHQYLSKPCDPETLRATVMRTSALRELLTDTALKKLVSAMRSLPSLPSLLLEVTEALKSPDISIQKVSQLIARDVGMTAKILQLVNSAFFGLRRRVDDLVRAISLLGLDTIKTLVLSLHIFSQCEQTKFKNLSLNTLWDHSFTTGVLARVIVRAEKQAQDVTDTAFTAGLLHDCGKLVLAANLPDSYGIVLTLARDQKVPLWEAEQEIFGVTHAEVGAYLLGIWGLPEPIVETLAFHHRPAHCLEQTFGPLTAVHVADVLEQQQHAAGVELPLDRVDHDYMAKLGLGDRLPLWREQCSTLLQGGNGQ